MPTLIPAESLPARSPSQQLESALSHDFCPWANRWIYWLKHPFWLLLIAAAAAIGCGVFVSAAVLALGASLLMLLGLGVAWPWVALRGLTAELRFRQTQGREREPIDLELVVTNTWPWPVWGLQISQGLRSESGDSGPFVTAVSGWSTEFIQVPFVPSIRGLYPTEVPQLETAFPFGLYSARKKLSAWNSLTVWPAKVALSTLPDAVELESREERTSDRRAGDVGDVLGTRGFRQGDSLRRVHWAQSARQGRLIVCERQQPASCALRLVLDLDPRHHGGEGREASLERLLRTAASIIESMHAQHALVECRIGHDFFRIGSAARDLRRCLNALAGIPRQGLATCAEDGLCCGPGFRHRALSEYIVTTERGFAALRHRAHWSAHHHIIVVGAEATPLPPECQEHRHCACRPWLQLSVDRDVLAELPRQWERACRVA